MVNEWQLNEEDLSILESAANLHETGLLIGFKKYGQHGAYIMSNTDMPGFTKAQKRRLVILVQHHKEDIDKINLDHLACFSDKTYKLLHILRLAVIFSMRRQADVLPELKLVVSKQDLSIVIPHVWFSQHPLMQAELEAECDYLHKAGQT